MPLLIEIEMIDQARNPVIFSPHRGAKKASLGAAKLLAAAATEAGAPEGAIQWSTSPEVVSAMMRHPGLALIVASGSGSIVRAAQATGTPCYGVGPGNVPVYVHTDADAAASAAPGARTAGAERSASVVGPKLST